MGVQRILRAVMAPLRDCPGWVRLVLALSAIGLCAALYSHTDNLRYPFIIPDGNNYTDIARGDIAHVRQPFISRQLGAKVAGAAARLLHWTVEQAFYLQAILALLFTLSILCAIALKTLAPRWMLFAIAVVPYWAAQVENFTLPDLWYSALIVVLLVLLLLDRLGAAALMMFPLMLSRESTSLTLVCFLAAAWTKLRWRDRLAAIGAAVAGAWVVGRLSVGSLKNEEQIPQFVYLLLKVPWNFLRNVLGIEPWSNLNRDLCQVPRFEIPLHIGSMTAIGACRFSAVPPYLVLVGIVYNFGLLPLLLAVLWWRHRHQKGRSVLLRFCLLYGVISFFLGPMLGTWIVHLLGYSWPLFFVALPLLMDEFPHLPAQGPRAAAGLGFFALHMIACAAQAQFQKPWYVPMQMAFWLVGWILLGKWLGDAKPTVPEFGDLAGGAEV